jgi:LysR family transcriptional activator of nhaA
MDWLNYHHLHYFWMVAREGNLTRAAKKLRLSPSTVSAQIKLLEGSLDQDLFHRQGRRLVLTDAGRTVLGYADQIFSLGAELRSTLSREADGAPVPLRLRVGIADILPKLIAWRFLQPALAMQEDVHLVCREDSPERLVADLAVHEVDVVLSDTPVGLARGVRAHTHPLGSGTVSLYAVPKMAKHLRRAWPDRLAGTPILLQAEGTTMRNSLDAWFADRNLRPLVVGEFEDSALLKAFGQAGVGCFAMPTVLEEELISRYGVEPVGLLDGIEERFFAITMSRNPENPALRRVLEAAGARLSG